MRFSAISIEVDVAVSLRLNTLLNKCEEGEEEKVAAAVAVISRDDSSIYRHNNNFCCYSDDDDDDTSTDSFNVASTLLAGSVGCARIGNLLNCLRRRVREASDTTVNRTSKKSVVLIGRRSSLIKSAIRHRSRLFDRWKLLEGGQTTSFTTSTTRRTTTQNEEQQRTRLLHISARGKRRRPRRRCIGRGTISGEGGGGGGGAYEFQLSLISIFHCVVSLLICVCVSE